VSTEKVSVFLDNSNIFRSIQAVKKVDPSWASFYDPLELAKRLAGKRDLVAVMFYCVHPPAYLLAEDERHKKIHAITNQYYSAIEKLPLVKVKYGHLQGVKGDLHEKNVDTQLSNDIVMGAALSQFDTAIIVSNDGDYVSAVENANKLGKKIEVVFFRGMLSMNLEKACDIKRRARRSLFTPLKLDTA
jgi:uncharacterized LabA/DUF88 family protein